MKLAKLISATLIAISGFSSAGTVIIQLSSGTSTIATGFADANSSATAGLVWGLIISNGDNVFTELPAGFALSTTAIATDGIRIGASNDWYFGSATLTANQTTGGEAGALGKIGQLGNINLGTGAVTGSRFAVVWFDRTVVGATATIPPDSNTKYGLMTDPSFVVPATGVTYNASGIFASPNDPIKPANTVTILGIPETSTALLGALGALGLLRRRR